MEQVPSIIAEVINIARAAGWTVYESVEAGCVRLDKASRQAVVRNRGGTWEFGYEPELHVAAWLEVGEGSISDIARILHAA